MFEDEEPPQPPDFPFDTGDSWRKPAKQSLRTNNPNSFATGRRRGFANADEATMTEEQRMKYNDPRTQAARKRAMAGNAPPEGAMGLGREAVPVMPRGLAGLAEMQERRGQGYLPGTMGGKVAPMPFDKVNTPPMNRKQTKALDMMNVA